MVQESKPTIEELEKMIGTPDEVDILPNGSIQPKYPKLRTTAEHHMEMARKLSECAVLKSQVKALREMRKDLLEACEAVKIRIHFIGWPSEPMNEDGPDWSKEIALLEVAINKAKKDWGKRENP